MCTSVQGGPLCSRDMRDFNGQDIVSISGSLTIMCWAKTQLKTDKNKERAIDLKE
jgi:hypothetical protein